MKLELYASISTHVVGLSLLSISYIPTAVFLDGLICPDFTALDVVEAAVLQKMRRCAHDFDSFHFTPDFVPGIPVDSG